MAEGELKQELYRTDLKELTKQITKHESTMKLKRRWLMDLPLSKNEQKRMEKLLPPNDMIMDEIFLREDDVGYEDIRTCIEKALGAPNSQEESICVQDDVTVLDSNDAFQEVSFLLDAMTNKGLCSFARILTEGLDNFDKTNWGMKRTIKELLPKVIAGKNDISRTKHKGCLLLLKDQTNFRGDQTVPFTLSESYRAAALKVLEGLKEFSGRTLRAMFRKLEGVKGYVPRLQPTVNGQGRPGTLIGVVRKKCTEMLSDSLKLDEPAEQLAGALGVAGLTLKLILNRPAARDFRRFSPEMESLHNDIAKAIHLLNNWKKMPFIELRKVQQVVDPNSVIPKKGLRSAIRNFLIEYLYECSDMDNIPDFFIEILDMINRRPQSRFGPKTSYNFFLSSKEFTKQETEEETQHVLNISAQAKEIVANLLPQHEFDEEFARAYMEDFDGSDTLHDFDDDLQVEDNSQHFRFHSYSSFDQAESIGETNLVEFNTPVTTSKRNGCLPLSPNGRSDMDPECMHLNKLNSNDSCRILRTPSDRDSKVQNSRCLEKQYSSGQTTEEFRRACSDSVKVVTKPSMFSTSYSPPRKLSRNEVKAEETTSFSPATTKDGFSNFKVEEMDIDHQPSRLVNGYLELQEACDNTSMVAYRFVGYMLDTLAKTEGLELHQDDRLYLHSHAIPEDTEELSDVTVSKFSKIWKNVLEQ